jgi:hypothetical protein
MRLRLTVFRATAASRNNNHHHHHDDDDDAITSTRFIASYHHHHHPHHHLSTTYQSTAAMKSDMEKSNFLSDEWEDRWQHLTSSDVAKAIFPKTLSVPVETSTPNRHHYTGLVDLVVNDVDQHFGLSVAASKVEWKCDNISADYQKMKVAAKKKRFEKVAMQHTATVEHTVAPAGRTTRATSKGGGNNEVAEKKLAKASTTEQSKKKPAVKLKEGPFSVDDNRFTVPGMRYETSHKTVRFYCSRCKEREICSLIAVGTIMFCAPLLSLEMDHLYFHDQVCEGVDKDGRHNISSPSLAAMKMCLIPFPAATRKRLFEHTYSEYLSLIDGTTNFEVQSIPEGQWINFGNPQLTFDDRHYTPLPGKRIGVDKHDHLRSMIGLLYHLSSFLSVANEVAPFLNDLDAGISKTSGQFVAKTFDKPNPDVHLCLEGESIIYGGHIMEPGGPFVPQLAHKDHELEDHKLCDNELLKGLTWPGSLILPFDDYRDIYAVSPDLKVNIPAGYYLYFLADLTHGGWSYPHEDEGWHTALHAHLNSRFHHGAQDNYLGTDQEGRFGYIQIEHVEKFEANESLDHLSALVSNMRLVHSICQKKLKQQFDGEGTDIVVPAQELKDMMRDLEKGKVFQNTRPDILKAPVNELPPAPESKTKKRARKN